MQKNAQYNRNQLGSKSIYPNVGWGRSQAKTDETKRFTKYCLSEKNLYLAITIINT